MTVGLSVFFKRCRKPAFTGSTNCTIEGGWSHSFVSLVFPKLKGIFNSTRPPPKYMVVTPMYRWIFKSINSSLRELLSLLSVCLSSSVSIQTARRVRLLQSNSSRAHSNWCLKLFKEKAQSKLTHRCNTLRINISSLCTFLLYADSEGCAACVLWLRVSRASFCAWDAHCTAL